MRNIEIKKAIKDAGLYLWQVAEEMRMRDFEFSRMLRYELTTAKKAEIQTAINALKERDKNDTTKNANN